MAYRSFLLTAALLLAFAPASHAGYAQAVPPPGFTTAAGVPVYKAPAGTAANAGFYRGFTSVPGLPAKMPYAMRFAANAPSYLAKQAFKTPAMFTPAGAAFIALPLMLQWLGDNYRFKDGQFEKKEDQAGDPGCLASMSGYTECTGSGEGWSTSFSPIPAGMCVVSTSGNCRTIGFKSEEPPPPEVWNPATPEMVPEVMPPIPPGLPEKLPFGLPVDPPVINPSPGTNPVPQPMQVPTSDPMPVPNTNPQEYKQPWVEVVPSPTLADPWRVSTRPIETTSTSPTPVPEPVTVPAPDPVSGTPAPTPAPTSETADFCALHPTALACLQKGDPGMLDAVPLFNEDKDVSQIQKTGSYGPANGSCPTGQTLNIGSTPIELGYGSICEFATMINPLVIGFAWLSAAFTFFGFARKD